MQHGASAESIEERSADLGSCGQELKRTRGSSSGFLAATCAQPTPPANMRESLINQFACFANEDFRQCIPP